MTDTPKKILPPVYFLFYLFLAWALHRTVPIVWVIPEPWRLWGLAPVVAGITLVLSCVGLFKARGTAIKPYEASATLVVEGPYRFTRNPMYVGIVTFLTGIAVMLGSLAAFLAPVAMFATLACVFVPMEEKMMEETFGQQYRDFKARVRRWI